MAAPRIFTVADAVVRLIQGASLPASVSVRRAWSPQLDLSELRDVAVVSVVPAALLPGLRDRQKKRHEMRLEIGIQKKLATAESPEIDALVELACAVDALFTVACVATDVPGIVCVDSTHDPLVSNEHLSAHRVFTSLIVARFLEAS